MQKSEAIDSANVPRGTFLDNGLIPVEEAAARLGMEPKRLRGFILRNKLGDPIGDMERVYEWSLPADTSAAVQP